MTNGRINKRSALLAILCVLVMVFAVPVASAASYSKVYGQTQDKVRVRESASTNATIIDNIVKDACIYITSSKTSGSNTFVQVKYRASDGSTATGWVCQSDGRNTYVKVLSTDQAKSKFKVSSGDLPSKAVGTFTAAERKASAANSDTTYIRENSSGATVSKVQTELKALGYYYGQITGNAGPKTVAAIKSFQGKNGLTADGIAGPQTIAKIDAAYEAKGGSSSGSGSSASGLKLNSKGTDVRNLQQDLTTLGYYWAEITGNFGAKTETAVRRFQEENGLTADGVAGTKTLNAIAAAVARKGGTPASGGSAGTTLKLNSQGTKVSQLQTDLKQLGYYYAEITGNFGAKTEAAVKAFQKAKGLTADGVAGTKTLNAIAAAVDKAGGSSSGSSSTNMKLGSTGAAVSALQQNLTTLGYYYGDITGHYGNLTQQAVKKFQKAKGLTQDGVASTATLNAITSALKNAGVDVGPGTVATTLREGDKGTAVTELQTMLKKLNYYYGSITGSFGSLTKQAVRKFQAANTLTVDGVCGAATLAAIQKAYSGSSSATTTYNDTFYDLNNWFTDKARMNALGLKRDAHCKMTDLRTGKSLNIYIQSTGNHADVEPLTAADTTTLCEIYGVSSADKIGWEARPILITVDKYQFICSIYGEAHGAEVIKDNNYSGQFCLHFTGSKTHNSGETLDRHKKAIAEAATILTKMGKKLQKGTP